MFGAIAGALGTIGGALIGKKASDKAVASAEANNPHKQLDEMTGGKYSNWLTTYGFRSPSEQAADTRKSMETMFPELNPWELAGTNAAGVAGSMGGDPNSTGMETAKATSQAKMQAAQLDTELTKTQIQAQTQIMQSLIQAETQVKTTELNNSTSLDVANIGISVPTELLNHTKDLMASQIQQNLQNTAFNAQQLHTEVERTIYQQLSNAGVTLDNEQKSLLNQKIAFEVKNQDLSSSQGGKTLLDAKGLIERIFNNSDVRSVADKGASYFSGLVDNLKGKFDIAFPSSANKDGVRGATTKPSKNKVQTHNPTEFGDDLPYIQQLRKQNSK